MSTPYRLNVGDVIRIGSLTMPTLSIDTPIQPDGTIILPQVGPITAAGKSIEVLRAELDEKYSHVMREPSIYRGPGDVQSDRRGTAGGDHQPQRHFAGQSFTRKFRPTAPCNFRRSARFPAQASR